MKNSVKFLMKGLLVIVLFTTGLIVMSTNGVKTVSEAKASVTQAQVISYLNSHGYTVITMTAIPNSLDWKGHTVLAGHDYTTTVHVAGSQIVGTEDVPFV